jgi:ssDNA-binding Zn-finger/Zn-ribbon topoisomerase 1
MLAEVRRLRCPSCRLTYEQAAIARVATLTAGAACPRCGSRLRDEPADGDADRQSPVRAVRSAVTGRNRLPYR